MVLLGNLKRIFTGDPPSLELYAKPQGAPVVAEFKDAGVLAPEWSRYQKLLSSVSVARASPGKSPDDRPHPYFDCSKQVL